MKNRLPRLTQLLAAAGGSALVAGGSPTIALDVDKRYHGIDVFYYSSGSLADPTSSAIDNVKVFVNGVTMIDASASQLVKLAKLKGITPVTGQLPIYFSDPQKPDPRAGELSAYDLIGQKTFAIQLTINGSATTPSVDILTTFDFQPNARPDGSRFLNVSRIKSITLAALPSGTGNITNIPTDAPIRKILFQVSANAISSIIATGDSGQFYQATKSENIGLLNSYGWGAATHFEYPMVFDFDKSPKSELVCSSLNLQVATTGALTPTVVLEQRLTSFR